MKLLDHLVVRSDLANWRRASPWPIALSIGSGIGITPLALLNNPPALAIPLVISVVGLVVLTMTWLVLIMARRQWCERHPYLSQRWLDTARTVLGDALLNAALIRLRDTPPCGHDRILRRGEMIEAILAERDALASARRAAARIQFGAAPERPLRATIGQPNR